jgi:hypothetical protein
MIEQEGLFRHGKANHLKEKVPAYSVGGRGGVVRGLVALLQKMLLIRKLQNEIGVDHERDGIHRRRSRPSA